MDKNGKEIFKLTEAKLKEGFFVGPQIRKLMKYNKFNEYLPRKEFAASFSLKKVI